MTIELTPEDQRVISLAINSGAYHDAREVIGDALALLAEDLDDIAALKIREHEPRIPLEDVEAELRALGKLK